MENIERFNYFGFNYADNLLDITPQLFKHSPDLLEELLNLYDNLTEPLIKISHGKQLRYERCYGLVYRFSVDDGSSPFRAGVS